jgi:hypothetical protein
VGIYDSWRVESKRYSFWHHASQLELRGSEEMEEHVGCFIETRVLIMQGEENFGNSLFESDPEH